MNKRRLNKSKPLRVVELFAGVGGFRLGLKEPHYQTVWNNQWEPATKAQHASAIYIARFGSKGHSNKNISDVDIDDIPDHDVLVGGFPCQDYSVAKTLRQAVGIIGKKGVLWWQIHRILSEIKKKKRRPPSYLILENVDRLLKSPSHQKGRDFAIILASLADLGYAVEWRVINAADYGFPQRRRRVFFIGYYKTTKTYKIMAKLKDKKKWLCKDSVLANAHPVTDKAKDPLSSFYIKGDLTEITDTFNSSNKSHLFKNTGMMRKKEVFTLKTSPFYNGDRTVLGDILLEETMVPEEFFIPENELPQWKYLKGAKHILRKSARTGREFKYDEGPMAFPDDPNQPSRTIVTGEGGPTPSRFKHVVKTKTGRLRRLTPIELESLNMFPPDHTKELSDSKRAFMMGNALVVGVVERLGKALAHHHRKSAT